MQEIWNVKLGVNGGMGIYQLCSVVSVAGTMRPHHSQNMQYVFLDSIVYICDCLQHEKILADCMYLVFVSLVVVFKCWSCPSLLYFIQAMNVCCPS